MKNKVKKALYFILGGSIVFFLQYFCLYLLKLFNIAFPSPILGIIIFFILLKTKIIKEKYIETFCNFILKYMILFFIPLFVGIISYYKIISANFWAIILTIFITTTLIIVLVGLFVENTIKYTRFKKIKSLSNGELKQ